MSNVSRKQLTSVIHAVRKSKLSSSRIRIREVLRMSRSWPICSKRSSLYSKSWHVRRQMSFKLWERLLRITFAWCALSSRKTCSPRVSSRTPLVSISFSKAFAGFTCQRKRRSKRQTILVAWSLYSQPMKMTSSRLCQLRKRPSISWMTRPATREVLRRRKARTHCSTKWCFKIWRWAHWLASSHTCMTTSLHFSPPNLTKKRNCYSSIRMVSIFTWKISY